MDLPQQMKAARRWCVWKKIERDGKATKVPYSAGDGRPVAVTEEVRACSRYDTAVLALKSGKFDGLGFVLGKEGDKTFVGVDIDHCRNPETGEFDDGILEIVHGLGSYAEISPSGTGVHIIGYGEKPPGAGSRKGPIEIYDKDRYFTVSGQHIDGTPADICDFAPAEFAILCERVTASPPQAERVAPQPRGRSQSRLTDDEVISLLCTDRSREALFNGDKSAYDNDDSRADLALCDHLAYWTNGDAFQMDRIFRRSGLMREKWRRDDYRELTINNALKDTPNGYEPPDYETGEAAATAFLKKDGEVQAGTKPRRAKAKKDVDVVPDLIKTVPGILQEHADYVNAINPEEQNQFAIASALLVGSAAAARRFKTEKGNPASAIVLLIDKSSRGKKAPIEAIGDALATANMKTVYQRGLWQSRQAIGSRLLFNAKPMVCHNEVGGLIGQASNKNGKAIKDLFDGINDLWDSPRLFNPPIYSAQGMRRAGMKADTDTTIFRPVVNIAMSCTEDDLFREVKSDLISSGTVPRWTVIVGDGGGQRDDFAPVEYPPQVGGWLRDISGHTAANENAAVMTVGKEQVKTETPLPMWERPKTDPEGKEIVVPITDGAKGLFIESRRRQRAIENEPEFSRIDQVGVLFGKVTEKAMRTALTVALSIAGNDYQNAVIDETAAEWALCWEWYHARKFALRVGAQLADTEFRALTVRVFEFLKCQVDGEGYYKAVTEGVLINRTKLNAHPPRVRDEVLKAVETDFGGEVTRTSSTVRGKKIAIWQYVGEEEI